MVLVSFLLGAAAARQWNWHTTLALVAAFCGFQAEHPLVLQIKQRKSWKPRFLVWAALYGGIAAAIALFLLWEVPAADAAVGNWSWQSFSSDRVVALLAIFAGAIAAFVFDAVSVWHREQKSVLNEIVTFAAVCLSAPFAFVSTTGTFSLLPAGLWLLNTLFFCSAIFTVKLRKTKTPSLLPGMIFHAIASLLVVALWLLGWLPLLTAAAFATVLLKFALILWQQEWYRTTPIQRVAMLETSTALVFLAIAALSLLPAHLPA